GRFVIEGLRTDSLMLGPIRISQLLSVLFLVAALVVMVARRRTKKLAWYWTSK
ncbi:prolipoprotein diacylglyceryl transferase family protein, partial [Limosilactobacillus oris]